MEVPGRSIGQSPSVSVLPPSPAVSNEVRFLLQSVSESNFYSIQRDLLKFSAYGSEGSNLLLQGCLDQLNGGDIQNLQLRRSLVSAIFKYLMGRPNFCTIFCQALRSASTSEDFLGDLSNTLSLSLAEKIGVALASFESDNLDVRIRGQNFCIDQIEDLIANNSASVVSHEQIQDVILYLYRSDGLSKHVDYFTKLLSLILGSFTTQPSILTDDMHVVNSPRQLNLFYEGRDDDFESVLAEIEKEMSMSDIMRELGYACTATTSHCKEMLSLFLPLSEETLSKLLGTIVCTHIGLDDTQNTYSSFYSALGSNSICESSLPSSWNIDILVDSIKQIAPGINWTSVIENLDHEGFSIPDKTSFSLLMSIYSKSCGDPFPLHAICGFVWKNAEGQLSFLKHAVSSPPDIFTFAHSSRQLPHADIPHLSKGGGNQAWSCLDLLDVLCQLSDGGHVSSVNLMVEHPIKECPEVLLVGIAHVTTTYNVLQAHIRLSVFPMILNDPSKNEVVHHLWEVDPNLVVRGFIDTYTDPSSLFRIVEICQELKILSSILDTTPFLVSFRLAAYAYRKEHMTLEKWLNENLTLYKDGFFQECLSFLSEMLCDVKNDAPDNTLQQSQATLMNAYQEICPTFFKVLQNYSGQLSSSELLEEFKRLHTLSNSKVKNPAPADISTSDAGPDDIEAEANAYFHQMFSGLLTIDAMVQMLARFKESSEKTREKLIFECMIANLFEEYKFFPEYPNRQLKIAAVLFGYFLNPKYQYSNDVINDDEVLNGFHRVVNRMVNDNTTRLNINKEAEKFRLRSGVFNSNQFQSAVNRCLPGSLIKNELVTHLALGIALRGVLDALRKSVDSKMFMFGIKALEQFMDRLVEWPQYCNHILQISHLRSSHSELVAVIERALARISSSQAESNRGNNILSDQQQGYTQASIESMEASEASWQFVGSSSTRQLVQQLSPFQLQQEHHGFLGDRLKSNVISLANTNLLLSNAGQSSVISARVDSVTNPKPNTQSLQALPPQHSAAVLASVSSSPGFLRPSRTLTSAGMLRQPSYSTGFGAALNIETLVAAAERRDTPIETPAQEIQDKMLFMINNISTANMEAKAKEFTEVIKEQYYPWFAQYMVMKRASIEPNFHDLYLKFLDKVNSKTLNKEIVKATYENCKVLLRSELIKSSSEERSLLKNLGSWLGKFTIGRNQALLAKEIDPKSLIIEAYERGLMIAVIPFTSKVLEPCQSSLAYKPPNPWTMAILGLLTEMYNLPNLKMNLKFDIEVLFKNLGVDIKDVKPTSLLKDRVREVEGNPDFSSKDISVSQAPVIAEASPAVIPAMNQVELQPDVNNLSHTANHPNVLTQHASPLYHGSNTIVEDEKVGPLIILERAPSVQGLTQVTQSQSPFSLIQILAMTPMYESHININPKLNSMGSLLQIHRYMKAALDKAIKDIVFPVIQRSVTIASRTTKELVLKDYAMESDAVAISRAAHLMVGTLAGSLAHVTCKEPLRVALSNHLRNLLQALSINGELLDQIVQLLTNDNIDLGCAVIEHISSEKAVELIDGEIGPSFATIRKQREAAGSAYYDAGTYAQGPFSHVPEALRPKPGRLSDSQQRVYNDFVRNIWQNQSSQSSGIVPAGPSGYDASVNSSIPRVYGSSSGHLKPNLYPTSQVAPGFSAAQQLDLFQEDSDRGSAQLGISPSKLGPNDGVIQPAVDVSTIVPPFAPTATSPELHIPETSTVSKDIGAFVQPSPRTPGAEHMGTALVESLLSTGDVLDKYQVLAQKLENLIAKDARETDIQGVIAEVPDIIVRCLSPEEAGLAVAQKVFKSLYDNAFDPILVVANLTILSAIRDICKLVVEELTNWVIYSDDERKFNKEITLGLIRSELLNLVEYDAHLGKLIDDGRNKAATEFAASLVQALVIHEPRVCTSELYHVLDALAKLAMRPGSPEPLQQLIEIARNNTANATSLSGFTANKEEKFRLSRDKRVISGSVLTNRDEYNANESAATDPTGLHDQVSHLFSEWCRICELPATNDTTCNLYISQLQQSGLLNGDDMTDRFFRIITELSVAHCLAHEQVTASVSLSLQSTYQFQHLSFATVDAYAKLVFLVLKCLSVDQGSSKVLLTKILSVTVRVIYKDAEEKKIFFNARPYFRLFINWILDLTSDSVLDGANFQVLTSLAGAFHALQPLKVPGFSFAWLELVCHRSFMPKLLTSSTTKGWPHFQRLLVDLFKFLEPYLRNAELGEPVQFLYRGTMRVLLVLLHDFPEFLCDYHFSFCDMIPPSCVQMRNVILSAFPRNMRLPDPSTPNLKIDLLAEISQPPHILSDVDGALKAKQIKVDIDAYMKTKPEGSPFLTELKKRLLLPQNEANLAGTRYNVPLINSLVLYVGMQAIKQLQSKSATQHAPTQPMGHNSPMDIFLVSAAMDIFQTLINNLDAEGRYLFLNAVANQLRYPNNHTHYFSFVLLFLFAEAGQEIIQEQITRVLLERLIVNRPHPWGLLITFIELIKNPRYSFWNRSFTRCAPEIEKLFESVSRSCGGSKAVDDGMVTSGIPDSSH